MKLQIEGQHLRVRIGEEELARLLAGEPIDAHTHLAPGLDIGCRLALHGGDAARMGGQPGDWRIDLPDAAVRGLAARLPSRDGLSFPLPTGQPDGTLTLLFDVDVRDSVRQRRPS